MLQNERRTTPLWKKIIFFIFSLILISIQISIYALTIIGDFQGSSIIYIIGIVLSIIVILYVINSDASASYKLTWVALIAFLPYFFIFLYFANYNAKILPKRKRKKLEKVLKEHYKETYMSYPNEDIVTQKLAKLIHEDSYYPIYKDTEVKFYPDAALKHRAMLTDLKKAQKYVFMEYFILSDGKLLNEVLDVLTELGNRGVEIKIIYDDIGSKRSLSSKTITRFISIQNLKIAVYEPLGLNINPAINYRDHRKICVIDGLVTYCGGDNLADEYVHYEERFGFWRDNAIRLEGQATTSFIAMFLDMWFTSTKERLLIDNYYTNSCSLVKDSSFVIPFADGPYTDSHVGYDVFKSLIAAANKTLYISTPYLIIDDEMINNICLQAKSGVDVKVLVPKIPDKKTVFLLTRAHYEKLLKSGVTIYEYSPGFNHAKNIIVDGKYAFCGTINMDYRSLFLHYECGAVLINDKEILKMEKDFLDAVAISENYTLEMWNKRNIFGKFFAFLLRIFAPML